MTKEVCIKDFLEYNKYENTLLIDARSPSEFKESHIKNAINLYALNDLEREEVGKLYKKSPFDAKMLGASYLAKNISHFLQNDLKHITPKTKVFIYCSRGGQRSGGIATILDSIGFRVYKLKGGYKNYRQYVLNYLDNYKKNNLIVLDGLTGSGKSLIIKEFENSIDLEKLANHYGSSFGGINGDQPTQKQFQNSLFDELQRVEKYKWILIEGESKKIGKLHIPSNFYKQILSSPRIRINSPLKDRVKRIVGDYQNIDKDFFKKAMDKISPYMEKEYLQKAKEAFYKDDIKMCASILLEKYYDKNYKKRAKPIATIEFRDLSQVITDISKIALEVIKK